MRTAIIAAVLALAATSEASAISRYNTQGMSCGSVQAAVKSEGAVILRYASANTPNMTLYDRYVAHGGFCQIDEEAAPEYVPTADTGSCPVLKCRPHIFQPFGDD